MTVDECVAEIESLLPSGFNGALFYCGEQIVIDGNVNRDAVALIEREQGAEELAYVPEGVMFTLQVAGRRAT